MTKIRAIHGLIASPTAATLVAVSVISGAEAVPPIHEAFFTLVGALICWRR
jgi:hypothetical protein